MRHLLNDRFRKCGRSFGKTPEYETSGLAGGARLAVKPAIGSPRRASLRSLRAANARALRFERAAVAPSIKIIKSSLLLRLPVGMWAKRAFPRLLARAKNGGSAAFGCKPIVHHIHGQYRRRRGRLSELVLAFAADRAMLKSEARIRNVVLGRWCLQAVLFEHATPRQASLRSFRWANAWVLRSDSCPCLSEVIHRL